MLKNIEIFSISDLHMGHPRVTSDIMLTNYLSYLYDNIETITKCDIFMITGDITDSLLYTNSIEYGNLLKLVLSIANMCVKYKLVFIYLNGTPSHEMGQMVNVISIVRETYPELECYFHDKIEYNEIKRLNFKYVSVPDQSASNDDELYSKVTSLFRKNKISKVDFMLTHTDYEEAVLYPTVGVKSTALWSNLVNYYIINGHIHYHSIRDSVITVGALDFHHHGDEELKGGVYITVNNYVKKCKHIPTKHYSKFKTLTIVDDNIKPVIDTIYKYFRNEKNPYFIKVIGNLPVEITNTIKKDLPLLRLMVNRPKSKVEKIIEINENPDTNILEITPSNVKVLIEEELGSSYSQDMSTLIDEHL